MAPEFILADLGPGGDFTDGIFSGASFTIRIRVIAQDGLLNSIRHAVVLLLRSVIHLIWAPKFSVPPTT
jgi:hypothetical protein